MNFVTTSTDRLAFGNGAEFTPGEIVTAESLFVQAVTVNNFDCIKGCYGEELLD